MQAENQKFEVGWAFGFRFGFGSVNLDFGLSVLDFR